MHGLISFLLFAVFFYLMMRFGCGAHMAHGHHTHAKSDKADPIIDPVCGKVVEQNQGYGKLHEGELYRFCSKHCLDEFDREPEKYIASTKGKGELS
ncbi:YHS domain-containing protein [Paraglaciecola sp. 25GB23A]|uniref:YHS domain-containing protein n=1 Tax=Paraglaciecola sp. 25GB23A TaxID=3156068 RepID=UPI0032AF9D53